MPLWLPPAGFGTLDIEHLVGAAGEPAFQNSWAQFGGGATVRFTKDPFGRVTVQGLLQKGGGNFVTGETLFVLPVGYRPSSAVDFAAPALGGANENVGRVSVSTAGVVALQAGGLAQPVTWFNINAIEFNTDSVTAYSAAPGGAASLAYAEITASITVTGTSGAPTTIITAPAFTADGIQSYWVEFFTPEVAPGAADEIIFDLWDSGTQLGQISLYGAGTAAGAPGSSVLARRKITPAAGTHQYIVKAWRATSNGSVVAGTGTSGNAMPAYIRVTPENDSGPQGSAGPGALTPRAASAAYSAANGDFIQMTGSFTVTLPNPVSGRLVGVTSVNGTGAAPCTVSTPTGAILGKGVAAAATSILLGVAGATAVLLADGTNWNIIEGGQNTGWIAVATFGGAWSNLGGSYETAAYRKDENGIVYLRGVIGRSGTYVGSEAMINIPYHPAAISMWLCAMQTGVARCDMQTNGDLTWVGVDGGAANGGAPFHLSLAGISFAAA